MKLAVLPVNKCFSKISVDAEKIAVRMLSQVDDPVIDHSKIVLIDQFNSRDDAEKLNHQVVRDCLQFEMSVHGTVMHKGISVADIDIRQIWSKVFVQTYREAFSLMNCILNLGVKTVIFEKNDPMLILFQEILPQIGAGLELIDSFGCEDISGTRILAEEYPSLFSIDFHPVCKTGIKSRAKIILVNWLSSLMRLIKGRRPFMIFSLYRPLEPVKKDLMNDQNYYPMLHQTSQLGFFEMVKCGAKLFSFDLEADHCAEAGPILQRYKSAIENILKDNNKGIIAVGSKKVSVQKFLKKLLIDGADRAFTQIITNIDRLDRIFSKENIAGYFGFCDSPWEERLLVRMCQKNNLPNAIMINGVLSNSFYIEAKTADKVFVYGETQKNGYLKDYPEKAVVTGNPLYEKAFALRDKQSVIHPPKKVLIGTSDPIPGDINSQYSSTESFLKNVMDALEALMYQYDFDVSIKLHPGESLAFYERLINQQKFRINEIISSGNMQEILMGVDLMIINHSVAVFEASLMGIPVLYYHPAKQVLFEPFNGKSGLSSALSSEELAGALKRMFEDREYALKFTKKEALEPFTGPFDGKAGDRIRIALNNIAGGKK